MIKNNTILDLRWSNKNPRIIYEDSSSIFFYILGDGGTDLAIWQEKQGLIDFFYEDYDRYHGSSWKAYFEYHLCEWLQNVTIALDKCGIAKRNMYLATREIFGMKEDPTNDETVEKIMNILIKYFENVPKNFNKKMWDNKNPTVVGYDFVYRYEGIKDLMGVFLTGYAFHYANCVRYDPKDILFNAFRSLKYRDIFYRIIHSTVNEFVETDKCKDIPHMHDRHYEKFENIEQATYRIRSNIILSGTGIEEFLEKNTITNDRKNLTKETMDRITQEIDNEILENKKDNSKKQFSIAGYYIDMNQKSKVEVEIEVEKKEIEVVKEKEK